ncbi:MAG: hypothetical protein NUV91_08440, partial [Candidatus Omnitrophica bacterium]|nr:hypothetical protein [Candidatus Omnitrophota bacterium]
MRTLLTVMILTFLSSPLVHAQVIQIGDPVVTPLRPGQEYVEIHFRPGLHNVTMELYRNRGAIERRNANESETVEGKMMFL